MTKFFTAFACSVLLLASGTCALAQDGSGAVDSPAGPMQSDRLSGKCLDFTQVRTSSVPAMMEPCSDRSHQQWYRGPARVPGYVSIHSSDNVCLGVSAANNSRVVAARCRNIPNQRWMLAPAKKSGRFVLKNQLTGGGVCLGIPETSTREAVGMSQCGGFAGQSWQVGG